jgi:hypothetical protein
MIGTLLLLSAYLFGALMLLSTAAPMVRDKLRSRPSRVPPPDAFHLRAEALKGAKHALEYDLPREPWYQLSAFWDRFTDTPGRYSPAPARYWAQQFDELAPKSQTVRVTWQLHGTDEDQHVLTALRNHDIHLGFEGDTVHLSGTREAVGAAKAEYHAGLRCRRRQRAVQRAAALHSGGYRS